MKDDMGTVRGPVSTERWGYMVWGAIRLACMQDGSDGPALSVLAEVVDLTKDAVMAELAIVSVRTAKVGDRTWPALSCLRECNRASKGLAK